MHSRYLELIKKHGTPLYVYDLQGLRHRVQVFKNVLPGRAQIHYAMKANHFGPLLQVLCEEGCGVDVVSGGELKLALRSGFTSDRIVFSGVGKTKSEIQLALTNPITQINVESYPELVRIAQMARELQITKPVPVALRMNPDVKTETHPYIQTGFRENKFGLDFSEVPRFLSFIKNNPDVLELVGLTLHIGSQIQDMAPIESAIKKTLELYQDIEKQGFPLKTFDVGGGVGINYQAADVAGDEKRLELYGQLLKRTIPSGIAQLLLEPGRILVARFGVLLTEVQYIKKTPYKNFVVVDTGMHHLKRPALYQAYHRIEPLSTVADGRTENFDVVGPICESADVIGAQRALPADLKEGDILAIQDVGAYGSVMMSDYNLRGHAPEVIL